MNIKLLKNIFNYIFLKNKKNKIIVYSENKSDWHFFENLIKILINKYSLEICYLTSDGTEKTHFEKNKNFSQFYIGNSFFLITIFQFLNSKLCLMTMGDLDNYHIKKNLNSINPTKYIFMPHTPVSAHVIDNKNYYKNYDIILCTGPQFYKEQKKMEEVYGHKRKELIKIGYLNFERMLEIKKIFESQTKSNLFRNEISCVLAPSWGKNMIIEKHCFEIIKNLTENNIKVFFRPHPRSLKINKKIIADILTCFKNHKYFNYNPSTSSVENMLESNVMISDWSGAAIEYAIVFKKPVLFIDTPQKIKNDEHYKLNIEPLEKTIRSQIGHILNPDKIETTYKEVIKLNELNDLKKFNFNYIYEKNYYNPNNSEGLCAKAIYNLYNK